MGPRKQSWNNVTIENSTKLSIEMITRSYVNPGESFVCFCHYYPGKHKGRVSMPGPSTNAPLGSQKRASHPRRIRKSTSIGPFSFKAIHS